MMSREEKNKNLVKEIQKEKSLKVSKKIFKVLGSILLVILLILIYAIFIEPTILETNEYFIKTNNEYLNGYKIIHFSDLYYNNNTNLDKIKEKINLCNPDLIFFTGDLINPDYSITKEDITNLEEFFNSLNNKYGIYSIYGDNDNNTYKMIMENANVTLLDNENIKVYLNTDYYINIKGYNINNLTDIESDSNYTITLIHNYDLLTNLTELNLAGDSLCGQIRLFNKGLIKTNTNLNSKYIIDNKIVYISNGIGSRKTFRFNNIPSINSYRLK